jgi:uncharacterized membrane protein
MNLTPLGVFHTILSLIAVAAAIAALSKGHGISPLSGIGRVYIWALVATCVTGLPIFRHGTIGPPHILGVLTLATFAVAAIARKTRVFGRLSGYVETATLKVYPGAPHGMCSTQKDQVNADLLAFFKA